ncbi:hypothetical protein [Embleya sp. MST-111070]|uniref:hypothetical protein n=1 Tax=Embleya sp. MST-111070 TaxID=3398231 RepID=UPI003F73F60F
MYDDEDGFEDCGGGPPDEWCGACDACREAIGDGIEHDVETGAITEAEARDAHWLNGTWDDRDD